MQLKPVTDSLLRIALQMMLDSDEAEFRIAEQMVYNMLCARMTERNIKAIRQVGEEK